MSDRRVVIVDFGMGNLFSVRNGCRLAGLEATSTTSPEEVRAAEAVILPGVGAFGSAMEVLRATGLIPALQEAAQSGSLVVGICLGMQLLMTESSEFGQHQGLGIVPGTVAPFQASPGFKVPQVGWNRIFRSSGQLATAGDPWAETPLAGLRDGEYMYFVHSFYVTPDDPRVSIARSRYGTREFCCALQQGNVYGFQFHPERSGSAGASIYRHLAALLSPTLPSSVRA